MIKQYDFTYNTYEASVGFRVDTERFTPQMALDTLTFFDWPWDEEADPVDEVLKKYALVAIKIATFEDYNVYGVTQEFQNKEGFGPVDGSTGLTLTYVQEYEFDEEALEVEIKELLKSE